MNLILWSVLCFLAGFWLARSEALSKFEDSVGKWVALAGFGK
jgi:hypothetical protein